MKISNRALQMGFSPVRKLVPFAQKAEKKGIKVYRLNIGQPDVVTPDSFFEGLNNYKDKIVKYSDSRGVEQLIENFTANFKASGINMDKEDILITQGGSEALFFTIMAICDEGDEILVPEPFYSNYNSFAKFANANIVPIPTLIENDFHLPSKEDIEALITPKTRIILFSNPVNPTGTIYTSKEIEMIGEIAKEHDLYIMADEVYRQFIYDEDADYISATSLDGLQDRIILIDSISKHYSACGARIGLLATKNHELLNQVLKFCQARLCASTIEQFAAANLINTMDSYFSDVKSKYKSRRDTIEACLSKIPGVSFAKPEGAFYVFAKLPIDDAEKFCEWLLTDYSYENMTLLLAPGPGFYKTEGKGKQEVRLSFCIEEEDIKNALIILEHALVEYNKLITK